MKTNPLSANISLGTLKSVKSPSEKIIPLSEMEGKLTSRSRWNDIQAGTKKMESERSDRLAEQNATPIDSIFRMDGKIIASVNAKGFARIEIGYLDLGSQKDEENAGAVAGSPDYAQKLSEYRTGKLEEILRDRYGFNLSIETRKSGLNMNEGQLTEIVKHQQTK